MKLLPLLVFITICNSIFSQKKEEKCHTINYPSKWEAIKCASMDRTGWLEKSDIVDDKFIINNDTIVLGFTYLFFNRQFVFGNNSLQENKEDKKSCLDSIYNNFKDLVLFEQTNWNKINQDTLSLKIHSKYGGDSYKTEFLNTDSTSQMLIYNIIVNTSQKCWSNLNLRVFFVWDKEKDGLVDKNYLDELVIGLNNEFIVNY